jgi:drug/metabolite transporter (DMT)-like permease
VAGSILVIIYSFQKGLGSFHFGDLALFGAIISAAVGYAVGGQLSKTMGGWQVICWALVLSFPFILIPAIMKTPENVLEQPFNVWLSFLYLALVSQLLDFFLWNKGLALGDVARVSQTQLIQPFVTIIASVILIGEEMDIETIIFAFLVVGTVALGKKCPSMKKPNE